MVAGVGIVINTAHRAAVHAGARESDLNIREPFMHMAADALVSAGVVRPVPSAVARAAGGPERGAPPLFAMAPPSRGHNAGGLVRRALIPHPNTTVIATVRKARFSLSKPEVTAQQLCGSPNNGSDCLTDIP